LFYTLTGSASGRGYPTFLIIFEKRKNNTHLHFHRVNPSRSKDGDYNPVNRWIERTYNYMCGNINKNNIVAQQGDLVFVRIDKELEFTGKVNSFDKHMFASPVAHAEGPKERSSNILCYVLLETDNELQHTEHENVQIPAGKYAIHQCRSYENSPRGSFSLRID
jgi:hypothetical protein